MAKAKTMQFGGVEVLVERAPTVTVGTEPTSTLGQASDRVLDGFDGARRVIEGAAQATLVTVNRLAETAASPDRFEIEFGLGFAVSGNVIVMGGSADATLKVKLTYERHDN